MKTNRFLLSASLLLAITLTLSCSALEDLKASAEQFKGNFAKGFLQNSALGFQSGGFPDAEVDGQVITGVEVNGAVLNGGSTSITVTSTKELRQLHIKIDGDRVGNGYYIWELEPEDLISNENGKFVYFIVLQFNQDLGDNEDGANLRFTISGVTKQDEVVNHVPTDVEVKEAKNGAMQISVSWDVNDDVDLYVTAPHLNDPIYYGNKRAGQADGSLDIDANYACKEPPETGSENWGVNSENIYFTNAPLEDGDYVVTVKLYQRCESLSQRKNGARYYVTLNIGGRFYNFDSGNQNGKFGDDVLGTNLGINSSNVKEIGTITIADGKCTNCEKEDLPQDVED